MGCKHTACTVQENTLAKTECECMPLTSCNHLAYALKETQHYVRPYPYLHLFDENNGVTADRYKDGQVGRCGKQLLTDFTEYCRKGDEHG